LLLRKLITNNCMTQDTEYKTQHIVTHPLGYTGYRTLPTHQATQDTEHYPPTGLHKIQNTPHHYPPGYTRHRTPQVTTTHPPAVKLLRMLLAHHVESPRYGRVNADREVVVDDVGRYDVTLLHSGLGVRGAELYLPPIHHKHRRTTHTVDYLYQVLTLVTCRLSIFSEISFYMTIFSKNISSGDSLSLRHLLSGAADCVGAG